jgi:adenylate kinase
LVIVLRTSHTILWDRLEKRKYSLKKIQENNEAEIMGECLEEARENYDENIVIELESESIDAIDSNIHRILEWVKQWKNDHQDSS